MNRLYVPRKQAGRGLTSIEDVYITRNTILADHVLENNETNRFIAKVTKHEEDKILGLGKEFKIKLGLSSEKKSTTDVIRNKLKHQHLEMWKNKQCTVTSLRNNKKRSHTQLDSRKQVIAFQDRVITINIKEAQHPLK